MNSRYQIPRYNDTNVDGSTVWQCTAQGLFRNGELAVCSWQPDVANTLALVDQWDFAHDWSASSDCATDLEPLDSGLFGDY